jgi:lipopolysaccharide transport system ATP-binding protein
MRGSSEALVTVEGVSKKFCRDLKRSLWYGMTDMVAEMAGARHANQQLRRDEFWAIKDVSFELKRGQCLGLIGRNGAGKTTLLRMLNGLIKPDGGRITMHGRVGALIALGAGFNPVLTGRENIAVNASVLGLSRAEISEKMDEIIDFAEIDEFIDAPVQSYSSGMQVRLGFAVATAISPDVLLLDEVLAVGDAGFRHKCYSRIDKLLKNSAVIFVSHSMEYVAQICHSVLQMRHGSGTWHADVVEGIGAYNEDNRSSQHGDASAFRAVYPPVKDASLTVDKSAIRPGESLEVGLRVHLDRPIDRAMISFVINNEADLPIVWWDTSKVEAGFAFPEGVSELRFPIGPLHLHPGKYHCSVNMTLPRSIEHCIWYWNQATFVVEGDHRILPGVPVLAPYTGHTVHAVSAERPLTNMSTR